MKNSLLRPSFFNLLPIVAIGMLMMTTWLPKPKSKFGGVQMGAITYSFRSMPHDVDKLIQLCVESNVGAIELMGDAVEEYAGKPKLPFTMPPFVNGQRPKLTDEQKAQMAEYNKSVAQWRNTVSMDKFKEVRKKFKKAGISIYAFKPRAFEANNTDAEVEYGMRAAKALGAQSITLEMPTDPAQTKRLGDMGAKHKMYVGYHAHLQARDTLWDVALAQSLYNTLNLDCGHYIAVGEQNTTASLLKLIEAKHDRITSMHMKDRQNKINGQRNLEWGKGDTPIKDILMLIKNKGYKFPVSVELEYDIPAGSDAVKEVRKCIEYSKNILEGKSI
jgi:sugar phosphate isomerase/epimerase